MSTGFPHDPFHQIVNVQWTGWDYAIIYTSWFTVQLGGEFGVNMFVGTTWRLSRPVRVQEVGIEKSTIASGYPDGTQLDRSDPPSEHITWDGPSPRTPGTVIHPNNPFYLYHTGSVSFFPPDDPLGGDPGDVDAYDFTGEWVYVNLKKIRADFAEELAQDPTRGIELTGKFALQNRPERAADRFEVKCTAYKLNTGTPPNPQYGTFEQEGFRIQTIGATKSITKSEFRFVGTTFFDAYFNLGTFKPKTRQIIFTAA